MREMDKIELRVKLLQHVDLSRRKCWKIRSKELNEKNVSQKTMPGFEGEMGDGKGKTVSHIL